MSTKYKPLINKYADYMYDKDGGKMSIENAQIAKIGVFSGAAYDVDARDENGKKIRLGERGAKINDVDLIRGTWYIQRRFPHEIKHIDDRDVVLIPPHWTYKDNPGFLIYGAKRVMFDEYGPIETKIEKNTMPDYYVAKCNTRNGAIYAGGFLPGAAIDALKVKLYDEYRDFVLFIAKSARTK